MKKKISLLLCVLIAVLSFAGCSGSKSSESKYNQETLQSSAETVLNVFITANETLVEQFKSLSDYELNYYMLYYGFPVDGEDFLSMLKSWMAAEEECGVYLGHGDYEMEVKNDGVKLSTLAEYENREATILFSFNEDGKLESVDVSAKYTLGEILTKAGLNTLLGMGTVFAVLLFLAFLISLMKYIPAITEKLAKKEETPVQANIPVAAATSTETVECADDLELVAVITAAIAAQEGTSTDGFIVRSIRRRTSNNWN